MEFLWDDLCTLWGWVCLSRLVAPGRGLGPRPKSALEHDLWGLNTVPLRYGVGKWGAANSAVKVAARFQTCSAPPPSPYGPPRFHLVFKFIWYESESYEILRVKSQDLYDIIRSPSLADPLAPNTIMLAAHSLGAVSPAPACHDKPSESQPW